MLHNDALIKLIAGMLNEYLLSLNGMAEAKITDPKNRDRIQRDYGYVQGLYECLNRVMYSLPQPNRVRGNEVVHRIKYLEHMHLWKQNEYRYSHVFLWWLMSFYCKDTARYIVEGM